MQCSRVYQLLTADVAQTALGGGLLIRDTLTLVIPNVRAARARVAGPLYTEGTRKRAYVTPSARERRRALPAAL